MACLCEQIAGGDIYPTEELPCMGPWIIPFFGIAAKEKFMENYLEKRISRRHSIEGPITLHSTIRANLEINAHVLNCSKEGICFSSK